MPKPHFRFIYIFLLLISFSSKAQVNLDSLWSIWNNSTQADTNRLKAINLIIWEGYLFSQPDSAFYFAQLEYDFAESVNNKKYIADALNIQACTFHIKGNYKKALDYYMKKLIISQEIENELYIADTYNNIGLVYMEIGEYNKALENYNKSEIYYRENSKEERLASCLSNIGIIYSLKGDVKTALDYLKRSLEIMKKLVMKEVKGKYCTILH